MFDRYTDRLSEYLDGDLDARAHADMEAHLRACAACRATLTDLRSVAARGASLPVAEPRADLWPGILRQIEAGEGPAVLPLEPRAPRRRFSFSVSQLAAAAVVLMMVSGGSVWIALRADAGAGADPVVRALPENPAARVVSNDSPAAQAAITAQATLAELERVLAENRDRLDPLTIAVLESNLRIIDAAIAEARAALDRDPANAYLSEHLGNTIEKKIEVLRRAASIGRGEI